MPDLSSYNETDLLYRISQGDEQAFRDFFYVHAPSMQRSITHLTGDDNRSQEIIQETFIKIWLSRDKLPSIDNIQGYLYRMAVNFFVMQLRKEVAKRGREKTWEIENRSASSSPAEYSRVVELKEIIANAVKQLPERRREIFTLSRDRGMTVSEIASELQVAESTVKNSLSTALAAIRQHLVDAGYESLAGIILMVFGCGGGSG